MRQIVLAVLLVAAIGCGGGGGGGNPTGPSTSIPNVVGSYNGNLTLTFPEVPITFNCIASTTVTQSGATVSIAPLTLKAGSSQCNSLGTVPVGQVTIDATGAFPNESGTYNEPSCGVYSYVGSGGFFGRDFKFSMTATSASCLNFNIAATLTR